jgi:hypothetical protein
MITQKLLKDYIIEFKEKFYYLSAKKNLMDLGKNKESYIGF